MPHPNRPAALLRAKRRGASAAPAPATKAPPRPRVEMIADPAFASMPRSGERLLGLSRAVLYRIAARGVPLVKKVGSRTLVDVAALRAHIAAQPPA